MKFRLRIAYVGTDYAGWQRQDNALAVQQVVEEALARILGRSVTVYGAAARMPAFTPAVRWLT